MVGVGAVILDASARVLLVKRLHPPLEGQWSLPGGLVELGESLAEAVVREVREETGLDVEPGPVVEVVDRVQRLADGRIEYHFVIVDYLCRSRGGDASSGSDAEAVQWVAPEDLARWDVTPVAIAVVHKALALARASF
jgi:ADP-ribose pyrophosphatase YjhB (NUDIX family)